MSTNVTEAARSDVTVTATVVSATSIDPDGCESRHAGSTDFGAVQANSELATLSDCTIGFWSTNDSAALRVSQGDRYGSAMWMSTDGSIDTAFGGGDGMIGHALGTYHGIDALVPRPDGTFLAIGSWSYNDAIQITKHAADGSLDSSWGTGGVVMDPGCTSYNWAQDIIEAADGTITFLASTGYGACLVRLNADGTRDVDFNGGNALPLGIRGDDATLDRLDDGRYIVGGNVSSTSFAATRITANGVVDASFGTTGVGSVGMGAGSQGVGAVVRSDDSVVLFGYVGSNRHFATALLTPDGQLDTTWGPDGTGKSVIELRGTDVTSADLTSSDGVAVAGSISNPDTWDNLAVARFDRNGMPDTSFSTDGMATDNVNFNEYLEAIHVQPDGAIIGVGGTYNGPAGGNLQLVRFTESGILDTRFGDGGRELIELPGNQYSYEMPIVPVPDGGVLVGGGSDGPVDGGDWSIFKFRGTGIDNYAAGAADWDTTDTHHFGICLRSVDGGATTDPSTLQPDTVGADCDASTDDPWNPIPKGDIDEPPTVVATSPSNVVTSTVNLRFGLRTSPTQVPGIYVAPIRFDVIAPAAP